MIKYLFRVLKHLLHPKCEVCKKRVPVKDIRYYHFYYVNGEGLEDVCIKCVNYFEETEMKRREYS